MTKQPKSTEVEWTSISVTMDERNRLKARPDSNRRTVRQEILAMLDAVEALSQDIDADMRAIIDDQKTKPTLDATG